MSKAYARAGMRDADSPPLVQVCHSPEVLPRIEQCRPRDTLSTQAIAAGSKDDWRSSASSRVEGPQHSIGIGAIDLLERQQKVRCIARSPRAGESVPNHRQPTRSHRFPTIHNPMSIPALQETNPRVRLAIEARDLQPRHTYRARGTNFNRRHRADLAAQKLR
jgi:hypothetical protein